MISYRMSKVVIKFLKKDATCGIVEDVNFETCVTIGFPHGKNRFVKEFVLEALKS